MTFRPRAHLFLATLAMGSWEGFRTILAQDSGRPWGGEVLLNWFDPLDLPNILDDSGLVLDHLRGSGGLSGIGRDPLSHFARPSTLGPQHASILLKAELNQGRTVPGFGRYILALAHRPHEPEGGGASEVGGG